MVNGAFAFRAGAGDLRLQRRDALLQIGDRQWVEVLPAQLLEQVVGADAGLVTFHDRQR